MRIEAACGCRWRSSCRWRGCTTPTTRSPPPPARSRSGCRAAAIESALDGFSAAFGRQERFEIDGRDVQVLLGKNPAGLNQVLRTLAARPERKRLALHPERRHRRRPRHLLDLGRRLRAAAAADRRGCSLSGTRAEDMALRLKYAGFGDDVPIERETRAPPSQRALDATPAGATLYVVPTYTAMLEVRELLAKRAGAGALLGGRMSGLTLRVAHLYPRLMNVYGDRGNIMCLRRRCEARGIGFELTELDAGRPARSRRVRPRSSRAGRRTASSASSPTTCSRRRRQRCARPSSAASSCSPSAAPTSSSGASTARRSGVELPGAGVFDLHTEHPGAEAQRLHRQHRGRVGRRHDARRLREPRRPHLPRAAARPLARVRQRLRQQRRRTATRAPSTRTPSAPTCTARCCRRTRPSPTTSSALALRRRYGPDVALTESTIARSAGAHAALKLKP